MGQIVKDLFWTDLATAAKGTLKMKQWKLTSGNVAGKKGTFLLKTPLEHDAASDEDRPTVGARPIDLFTSYGDVSLETVKKASTFYQRRGQTYHVQNLLWSGTNILNSCDKELLKKIEELIIGYPIEHKTGPVFFKLMMGMVQASSALTMRVSTQQLEALSIKDFDGESVISYASIMRGVVEQLKNNNAVPRDYVQLIADGLKKTSTEDFASYISLLLYAHTSGIKLLTEEALLNEAEKMYMDVYARGKWDSGTGKDKQDSVFFAGKLSQVWQSWPHGSGLLRQGPKSWLWNSRWSRWRSRWQRWLCRQRSW